MNWKDTVDSGRRHFKTCLNYLAKKSIAVMMAMPFVIATIRQHKTMRHHKTLRQHKTSRQHKT